MNRRRKGILLVIMAIVYVAVSHWAVSYVYASNEMGNLCAVCTNTCVNTNENDRATCTDFTCSTDAWGTCAERFSSTSGETHVIMNCIVLDPGDPRAKFQTCSDSVIGGPQKLCENYFFCRCVDPDHDGTGDCTVMPYYDDDGNPISNYDDQDDCDGKTYVDGEVFEY